MTTTRHVIRNPKGGWSVQQAGASRAIRVFRTQQDAVRFAKQVSRTQGGDLFVHHSDGTIRERDSYGRDPHLPKDHRR
jgi:hypothetical protein